MADTVRDPSAMGRSCAQQRAGRAGTDVTPAVRRTRAWFEVNSGWAPPDAETLADWLVEGASRCPDDCWTDADGECEHGLATWATLLAVQAREDDAAARSDPGRRTSTKR